MLALVLSAYGRAAWRRLREYDDEHYNDDGATRVLVVGAGEAGRELISSMLRDPRRQWQPVGILDDDPAKRHRRVRQVPVLGRTGQLAEKAQLTGVGTVVIALPSASAEVIARLRHAAIDADLEVKVLPASTQLLNGHVGIRDLRDINLTDVLGRNQLDTDIGSIADYLQGRRVLVTGAGGSIGSELCRQIHGFEPAELMMLDRDESALHAVQLSIYGHGLLDTPDTVLVDIRDNPALAIVFEEHRPEIVFHAAALKHLPMLERFSSEGWKTNVLGTLNLLRLSEKSGVGHFVNISTDKAADPSSVLGATKRIAEQLTAWQAKETGHRYISVRFGNVLGSRGSMLQTFTAQIEAGGPITVTHPDVSRYFMTIPEACELVVQAGAIGGPGDLMVLEMGDPVKILDVAKRMITLSGAHGVEIVFTGLRPGEKLHEKLFGDDERADATEHPMIRSVPVPVLDPAHLSDLAHVTGA